MSRYQAVLVYVSRAPAVEQRCNLHRSYRDSARRRARSGAVSRHEVDA